MKRVFLAIAVLLFASAVWSQPYGMGPGMMGGYGYGMGPGMMGAYGPGYGMGPGMVGGYGPGYGMGPGMMGSYGPGYGMGPGMMGGYGPGYAIPDLSGEQREKLARIGDEFRKKQWKLMESMHDLMFSSGRKFDEKSAREAYDAMAAIRKQMFENSLEARKQFDGVLTNKQREQLRRSWGG